MFGTSKKLVLFLTEQVMCLFLLSLVFSVVLQLGVSV